MARIAAPEKSGKSGPLPPGDPLATQLPGTPRLMQHATEPAFDPFIVATSLDKADSATRKFIRSHVMRGKNKGKSMPRKGKTQCGADTDLPSQRSDQTDANMNADEPRNVELVWEKGVWPLTTPRKVAAELSLFRYTADLTPPMRELIYRAFTVVKPATYAVQLFGKDERSSELFCFNNLSSHPAMVPALLFTAQAFYDTTTGASFGSPPIAQFHLAKTLKLLRVSLEDETEATSYSTMVVVASLATAAVILGDMDTAGKHLDGLHKMVQARGGLASLGRYTMVAYKAVTLDLGLAMGLGTKLRFTELVASWSPEIADGPSARFYRELDALQPRPDPRLLNVWADLREFSRAANEVVKQGTSIQPSLFFLITSVLHRLLRLEFDQNSLSEVLRLGMLAYSKTIMIRLQGLGKKMTFLAGQLKAALDPLPTISPEGYPFVLWVLVISALSIFEDFEPEWIRRGLVETTMALGLRTWPEMKAVLKRFLWVDALHDELAKTLFDELLVSFSDDFLVGFKATFPAYFLSA